MPAIQISLLLFLMRHADDVSFHDFHFSSNRQKENQAFLMVYMAIFSQIVLARLEFILSGILESSYGSCQRMVELEPRCKASDLELMHVSGASES